MAWCKPAALVKDRQFRKILQQLQKLEPDIPDQVFSVTWVGPVHADKSSSGSLVKHGLDQSVASESTPQHQKCRP